ncbi:hypothetical protein GXW78_12315 [Roseomonas terrae]|uniref:Uncharacterized protein n=1 Tax=Neoroseomonas terrae TaxID=424799 RepID=A0ABS5EHF3_9PROT|nr:hypothetical protein [Neoroseomonas terrae]MBR0650451.1 hypothetical protein [Neoroseomonas terrae]
MMRLLVAGVLRGMIREALLVGVVLGGMVGLLGVDGLGVVRFGRHASTGETATARDAPAGDGQFLAGGAAASPGHVSRPS